MKKILVVVDMQNDFITGSLGNDDCRAAVKGCVDLCKSGEFDKIVFTRDTHDEGYMDSLEGQKLPVPHCVRLTNGWQVIPELLPYMGSELSWILDKRTFGCEALPGEIARLSNEELHDACELHFCGVCTSICVLANMVICRAAFPNTRIVLHTKATGDVTEEMKQAAFVCAKAQQCDIED